MCRQVEVSATGRSLVQRSLTECDASECVCEVSTVKMPKPCRATETCNECMLAVVVLLCWYVPGGTNDVHEEPQLR